MSEDQQNNDHHTKRDGETQVMLGGFMIVLALPVILGAFFANTFFNGIVCFLSGLVLLAIGGGFCFKGANTLKQFK